MIELYLSKVDESSETEQAGKLYARVSYKETMGIHEMAEHMAHHNTAFSEGLIVGVLTDFVKCVREMVLSGNTVKVGNLAIFKATVEANGLETLYDAEQDKVAQATMGTLAEGAKTGPAVKVIKLLAQSTGDFTREELKKDVKFSWTDKTKAEIAAAMTRPRLRLLLPRVSRTAVVLRVARRLVEARMTRATGRRMSLNLLAGVRPQSKVECSLGSGPKVKSSACWGQAPK